MRLRGFTLIELFIVILIISLLVAILLPALASSRESARRVMCGTNVASIGRAMHTRAADHNGSFMPALISSGYTPQPLGQRPWDIVPFVHRYLSDNVGAMDCPTLSGFFKDQWDKAKSNTLPVSSTWQSNPGNVPYYGTQYDHGAYMQMGGYGYLGAAKGQPVVWNGDTSQDFLPGLNPKAIPRTNEDPGQWVLLIDQAAQTGPSPPGIDYWYRLSHSAANARGVRGGWNFVAPYPQAIMTGSNHATVDGSVEWVPKAEQDAVFTAVGGGYRYWWRFTN